MAAGSGARRVTSSIVLATALALTASGCGSDGGTDTAAITTTTPSDPTSDIADGDIADSEPDHDEDESGGDGESPTVPGAGRGSATVVHGGTTYEFVVLRCVEDRPSFDRTVVEFSAEGVPVGTPQPLIDDVLAASIDDPDLDITSLLEPVFEFGPVLTVNRLEDGGDLVALFRPPMLIQSSSDFRDPDDRFLELADDTSTATGSAPTDDGGSIELDLTCP